MIEVRWFTLALLLQTTGLYGAVFGIDSGLFGGKDFLGRGFSTPTARPLETCLTGEQRVVGDQQASLTLEQQIATDQLEQDVKSHFKSNLDLGFVSGSASAKLSQYLHHSDFNRRLVYRVSVDGKTRLLDNPSLTPLGEAVATRQDRELIEANCGDEVVVEVKVGAKLYLVVDLRFKSQEALQVFDAKVRYKAFGLKKTKRLHRELHFLADEVEMRLDGFQFGGDPSKLAVILAQHRNTCVLSRQDECEASVDALWSYATSEAEGGFQSQIRAAESLSVISVRTKSYRDVGFPQLHTTVEPVHDKTRSRIQGLRRRLLEVERDLVRAEEIIEFYPKESELRFFARKLRDVSLNPLITDLNRAITRCLTSQESCAQLAEEFGHQAPFPYDRKPLYQNPEFMDFCAMPTTLGGEKTVAAILKATGKTQCTKAFDYLQHSQSIEILDSDVQDLRPLRGLPLRRLTLSGNKLQGIETLRALQDLEFLDLSHNQIDDISTLGLLRRLEHLDISYNSISRVGILSGLSSLKHLFLHGNLTSDLSGIDHESLQTLIVSEEDLCQQLRQKLAVKGWLDKERLGRYQELEFAPFPAGDSFEWARCEGVAPSWRSSDIKEFFHDILDG